MPSIGAMLNDEEMTVDPEEKRSGRECNMRFERWARRAVAAVCAILMVVVVNL